MSLNATSFLYLVAGVTTPGTAEQLTAYVIPDGLEVIVTARVANADAMYLANTQTNAQTAANRKRLEPGQSTTLRIDNTNKIWIDAESAADRLEITVQRLPSTGG